MKNKRYLVEVQETTNTLGGEPRIAGTRLSLERIATLGLMRFKKAYPETERTGSWWSPSIKEIKVELKKKARIK